MSKAKGNLVNNIIPIQFTIERDVKNYRQKVVQWNPVCDKKNALFYEFTTKEDTKKIELIPDACIDIIFSSNVESPNAIVIGHKTKQQEIFVEPNTTYFGFKPYSTLGMKDNFLDIIGYLTDTNKQEDVEYFGFEKEFIELNNKKTFDDKINFFVDFMRDNLIDYDYDKSFTEFAEIAICNYLGNVKIKDVCDYLGYSERYCRKIFKQNHKMSLKEYSKIMRLQNTIRIMQREINLGRLINYADIGVEAGYYDQAHFNREFKSYMNCTPADYKDILSYNSVM